MTETPSDSILGLVEKIARQIDEFEIHLISYQDKVRKALTESV